MPRLSVTIYEYIICADLHAALIDNQQTEVDIGLFWTSRQRWKNTGIQYINNCAEYEQPLSQGNYESISNRQGCD